MTTAHLLVLATRDQWERLGDRFSGEAAKLSPAEVWGAVLVCLGLLGMMLLLRLLAGLQIRWAAKHRPSALMGELCRAHRLRHAERQLLAQMAEQNGLRLPAEVFVRPELFAEALYAADTRQRVAALRERLFAGCKELRTPETDSAGHAEATQLEATQGVA